MGFERKDMGRRRNNPELVEELIENLWTQDHDDFDAKYESLSMSDKHKVAGAIAEMDKHFYDNMDIDMDDDDW